MQIMITERSRLLSTPKFLNNVQKGQLLAPTPNRIHAVPASIDLHV